MRRIVFICTPYSSSRTSPSSNMIKAPSLPCCGTAIITQPTRPPLASFSILNKGTRTRGQTATHNRHIVVVRAQLRSQGSWSSCDAVFLSSGRHWSMLLKKTRNSVRFSPSRDVTASSKPRPSGTGISTFHSPGFETRHQSVCRSRPWKACVPCSVKNSLLRIPLWTKSRGGGPSMPITSARCARVVYGRPSGSLP